MIHQTIEPQQAMEPREPNVNVADMTDPAWAAAPMLERIHARLERIDTPPDAVLKAAGLPADFLDKLRHSKARVPRGQRLIKLAEALGTSVSYLVGLDPDVAPPQELLEEDQGSLGLLAGDEDALLRAYRRLDVASRAAALHVLLKMAGPEPEPASRGRSGRPRAQGRGPYASG